MAERSITAPSNTWARELPRSPTSLSPASTRRGSLRSSNNTERESIQSSPPARLTRKQAASIDTDTVNHPSIEDLSLHSSGINSPQPESGNHVCLCQPDPKIPRPRNGTCNTIYSLLLLLLLLQVHQVSLAVFVLFACFIGC